MSTSITSPRRLRDVSGEKHEYVVSLTDRQACALRYIAHERVIRCRDCWARWDGQSLGLPIPDEGCCYCASRINTPGPDLSLTPMRPLTGFCAWGKPREQAWKLVEAEEES